MLLTKAQTEIILKAAISYLGHPYRRDFSCVDFARKIYDKAGIKIPKLKPFAPPSEFNITREHLKDPPPGHLIFLKDPSDPRSDRAWTHVGIIMPSSCCIHCSLFFGEQVTISSLTEILERYDFVDSKTGI